MKRKINENLETPIKIDVVSLASNFNDLSVDEMADALMNNLGVTINKQEVDGTVYMIINGSDINTVIDEIADFIYANDSEVEDIDDVKDVIDDCILEDEGLTEAVEAYDEYEDITSQEPVEVEIEDGLEVYPAYDEVDIDDEDPLYPEEYDEDEYDKEEELNRQMMQADAMLDWQKDEEALASLEMDECDKFEDMDEDMDECDKFDDMDECDDYDEDDSLNDCEDEDKEFECYESKKYRSLGNGIYESVKNKKKRCCPPKRSKRMVNLSEALKSNKTKLSARDIVRSAKQDVKLNESIN